jgi:hypothetical protein
MQSNRKNTSAHPPNIEEAARRTTIILEKGEREYIDALIREGKEPGIKPLISKMLDIYKGLMVYDWRFPGEYYYGISRIAFVNVELLNILIQQTPKEKWRQIGKTMGSALKVAMETTLDMKVITQDNWESVFKKLRIQGFGEFYLKDKYLLVKTPFIIESEILAGILEAILDIEVDTKTSVPPIVFEIKKGLNLTT